MAVRGTMKQAIGARTVRLGLSGPVSAICDGEDSPADFHNPE
jgi:hypothetical protein